jgi:hypothetical protein
MQRTYENDIKKNKRIKEEAKRWRWKMVRSEET